MESDAPRKGSARDPDEPFRDVEVLNLDGLPEAEALKLAVIEPPRCPSKPAPVPQWQRFEFARMPVDEATQSRNRRRMQGDLLHICDSDVWS